MMQRKDMTVIEPTEPLINLYYNGPERRSDRNLHAETAARPWRLRSIVRLLLQETLTPYAFSKNMAYYLAGRFDTKGAADLLLSGTNTFIIRDPRAAIPSHYKQDSNFSREEAGYSQLRKMFDIVRNSTGKVPTVIDGDAFCRNPRSMMQQYCSAVGIPFDSGMMQWESGQVAAFDGYAGWTETAESSTGFQKPPGKFPDLSTYPSWLGPVIEKCRHHYEYLLTHAMKPEKISRKVDTKDGLPDQDPGAQSTVTAVAVTA